MRRGQQTPLTPAKAGVQSKRLGPRFRGDEWESEYKIAQQTPFIPAQAGIQLRAHG